MYKNIKVSVIVPVYNVELYLSECLNSLLNQTLKEFEIICIDDASTDDSFQIMQEYKSKFQNIYIYRNETNKGPSYTRNRGLELASGQYVYFLDSDDMITPNCLECLYEYSLEHNLDICYFDIKVLYENEQLKEQFKNYNTKHNVIEKKAISGKEMFAYFIEDNSWSCSSPRQFFKYGLLQQNDLKFAEGELHEDEAFAFEAALKAERVAYLPEELFIRRFRENSIMTTEQKIKNMRGLFFGYCKMLEIYDNGKYEFKIVKAIETHLNKILSNVRFRRKSIGIIDERIFNNDVYQYLYDVLIENKGSKKYTINESTLENLIRAEKVYVYGAGVIAKSITMQLLENNIFIQSYVVSDKERNPEFFLTRPVISINEMEKNATILIAVTKAFHNEIKEQLKSNGYSNIECFQYVIS